MPAEAEMSQQSKILYQQSPQEISSLFWGSHLLLWIAPSCHKIAHGYHHISNKINTPTQLISPVPTISQA